MSDVQATIYDTDLNPVADLKNAHGLSYSKVLNNIWQAQFSLPTSDPHFDEVQGRRFIELFEDGDRIDLFRIERPREGHDDTTFKCKHVLSTLLDDFLVNTHSGVVGTDSAIDYVLGEQSTTHWQKGTVDFSHSFHHAWTDRTLLYALFEIPNRYNEDYQWTWDTSSYPWTINLIAPDTDIQGLIYYENNAEDITKDEDYSDLITKLYAYGNGSGAAQVSLSDSSYTSNDYILDSTAQGKYGTITRVWEDQRYTVPDNLYEAAQARLDRKSTPRTVYSVDAIDIFRKTGFNELAVGQYYTVRDKERGIDVDLRIEKLSKGDLTGKPSDVNIELANKQKAFPDHGRVSYADDLDQVKDGTQYAKVYSTQIEAGEILLSAIKGGATPTMPATPNIAGLYLGADHLGYHNGTNWITYMDLDGKFRLEGTSGYLHWNPATETLEIKGALSLTNTISSGDISDVDAYSTGQDEQSLSTLLNDSPSSAGLFMDASHLGYYDGASWQVYVAADGKFYFGGDANNYIQWDGATLEVSGAITITNTIDSGVISDVESGADETASNVASGISGQGALATLDKVNTTTITSYAITTPKLNTKAVTTDKIDANAITADKISVTDLSAISGDFGEINSGFASFAGGAVQIGENVTSDNSDGIYVSSGGKVEIEDQDNATIFDSGGKFQGGFKHIETLSDSDDTTPVSIDFNNLPDYDEYIIRYVLSDVESDYNVKLTINNITTADYYWQTEPGNAQINESLVRIARTYHAGQYASLRGEVKISQIADVYGNNDYPGIFYTSSEYHDSSTGEGFLGTTIAGIDSVQIWDNEHATIKAAIFGRDISF